MDKLIEVRKRARQLFNKSYNGSNHPSFAVEQALLTAAKELGLDHYGVDGFVRPSRRHGEKGVTYLNMGDVYVPTVYVYTDRYTARFCVGDMEKPMSAAAQDE